MPRTADIGAVFVQICAELAQRNIPFHIVVAGDAWLDYRLSSDQLSACRAVITTPDEQWLDADQKSVLAEVRAADRLLVWPNDERLKQLVPQPITVVGSDKIMTLPRFKPADPQAPVVLHLLNRDYDGATDTLRPQRGVTVQVRRDLLPDRAWSTAKLHVPAARRRS